MSLVLSKKRGQPRDDRLEMCRILRGAEALSGAASMSAYWIVPTVLLCSQRLDLFGNTTPLGGLLAAGLIGGVCGAVMVASRRFEKDCRKKPTSLLVDYWSIRVVMLTGLLSCAWGLVAWLLWQDGNIANHLFVSLIALSVVARFLVSRSVQPAYFIAALAPMAILLFMRASSGATLQDIAIAAIVCGYAAFVARDTRRYAQKLDATVEVYYAHQDMAEELKKARDEALRKTAEAEQANILKTKFMANMSHELRTPLNAILGFSEMIAREKLGPVGSPRYREYANDIHISGEHLLTLINDLLDVSKIEAGKMEIAPYLMETSQALESSLRLITARARERSQTVSLRIAPDATQVYADERAFKQILINLVSNAVKYTHEGGQIDIVAERSAAGEFQLMVGDNGYGIPKDKLVDIFNPFSQVDNRYDDERRGTGLGLALVKGLADVHGGRAWIESEEGNGTRAFVVFPPPPGVEDRRYA